MSFNIERGVSEYVDGDSNCAGVGERGRGNGVVAGMKWAQVLYERLRGERNGNKIGEKIKNMALLDVRLAERRELSGGGQGGAENLVGEGELRGV